MNSENLTELKAPENAIFYLKDAKGFVALVEHHGNDLSPVNAARASFGKTKTEFDSKDEKLLKYLLEHNHNSPLEMTYLQFLIKAPLYISTQHLRHRISSFNFTSYRYTELKEECDFYLPKQFRKQSQSNKQASTEELIDLKDVVSEGIDPTNNLQTYFDKVNEDSYHLYKSLLAVGVAREQARGVLPQCTYTTYYWGCNLRSFLHFIELRDHNTAQWEIQQLAKAMMVLVEPIFPKTIQYWKQLKKGKH